MNTNNFLEIKNIYKRFKGVQALENVSVEIRKGEIHSIIGENGAGKSTLVKIITGVLAADSGKVLLEGKEIHHLSIEQLFDAGISAAYQESSLFENLTVAQNIFISELFNFRGFNLSWDKIIAKTENLLKDFNLQNIKPLDLVSELSPEPKQMLEIIKCINRNPKILCLDEPTASMSESGVELLFKIINKLKEQNKTILYISHNLDEILKISDRITVLRDGKKVKTLDINEADKKVLHQLMIGRSITQTYRKKTIFNNNLKPLLRVENLYDSDKLKNINFEVYPKEILGISGLVGAGRTELACAIFGINKIITGKVFYKEKLLTNLNPVKAVKNGIIYLPEDRKLMGLYLNQSIKVNVTSSNLNRITKCMILNSKKEKLLSGELLGNLDLKYSNLNQLAQKLSGGNQQKLLFGKCLFSQPELLILDEPTRGIDVGAKEEIYDLINKLVEQGLTIILISSEIEEICRLSDRVLVMVKGEIVDTFKGEKINEKDITSCYLQTEKRK